MTLAWLFTAMMSTAVAAEFDGQWEMVSITTNDVVKTAQELMPEGCTSTEMWSFDKGVVSRGHTRSCTTPDATVETCEVWVKLTAADDAVITIPYTTEALSQIDTVQINESTKKGITTTRKADSTQMCGVRLDKAAWTTEASGDELTLTLEGGAVSWRLRRSK